MKKLNIVKLLISGIVFVGNLVTFAAIDHIEITTNPEKFGVSDSVDLTIRAVGKDGKTDTTYKGSVMIYSPTDNSLVLPNNGEYEFTQADAGVVKFENTLKFSKEGKHTLEVLEMGTYDILGTTDFDVAKGGSSSSTTTSTSTGTGTSKSTTTTSSSSSSKADVTITYPTAGLTLGTNTVKVTGTTQANHKVVLSLNTKDVVNKITDATGKFEFELKDLKDGQNTIFVSVFDANNAQIGKSSQVLFTIEAQAPTITKIDVKPGTEVEAGTVLNVEVQTQAGMLESKLTLGDVVAELKETSKEGTYTGVITAPSKAGNYDLGVSLKNSMGNSANNLKAKTIIVTEKIPVLNTAPVETPKVEEAKVDLDAMRKGLVIKGLKLIRLQGKSILQWDKIENATGYNVYKKDKTTGDMVLVEKVTDPKIEINVSGEQVEYDDFAVKALLEKDDIKLESENYSDMTKVQTGPEMVIAILMALIAGGMFTYYRRKKA